MTKILRAPTRIASIITRDNATSNVPILAPQITDKYAILNPKNIIPTSLTNAIGLNSITVETRLNVHNANAIFCIIIKMFVCSKLNPV